MRLIETCNLTLYMPVFNEHNFLILKLASHIPHETIINLYFEHSRVGYQIKSLGETSTDIHLSIRYEYFCLEKYACINKLIIL